MPAQMNQVTMGADMDSSTHQGCNGCEAGKGMALPCLVVCSGPGSAVLPHIGLATVGSPSNRLPLPRAVRLRGTTSPPTPFPPRTTYIG